MAADYAIALADGYRLEIRPGSRNRVSLCGPNGSRFYLKPKTIRRLLEELPNAVSAVDLLASIEPHQPLRERLHYSQVNVNTVGELIDLLLQFPRETRLGETRLIEQAGRFHECFDHLAVYAGTTGHVEGKRGLVVSARPEVCPPREPADAQEALILGRSKLCDRCDSIAERYLG